MIKKAILATVLAGMSATGVLARSYEVPVWLGEKTAVRVPHFAENEDGFTAAPAGITVRFGVLQRVRYLKDPENVVVAESLDRVEWGSSAPGRKVVEISAAPDARPGLYECGMLRIRVLDRTLPPAKDWAYYLDLWQHPWAVARTRHLKPFSPGHYAAMRPLWELLAEAGQKVLTVTILDQPWDHQCYDAYHSMVRRVKRADGSWSFDYSLFDAYVAFGKSCGIGPDIACYTMCPWRGKGTPVVRYENEKGESVVVEASPGGDVFKDFWGDFLVDFKRHLEEKGWFEQTYIAMDERTPEDLKKIRAFIDSKAKGFKISMAGNMSADKFRGIEIENYCQFIRDVNPDFLALVPMRRAKGYVTTYYVCCGPRTPNSFLTSWTSEAFWLGAYPAFAGLDGFLRWAYNSWPQDAMTDASYGVWAPGDTFLVYPDGSPSLRFLELRNGIVAAEKMRLLRKAGALDAAKLKAASALVDAKKAVANECNYDKIRQAIMELVNP